MNNKHQNKHQLTLADIISMFILKAPDMKKAIVAIEVLFGPHITSWALDYHKQFSSYQDWRNHLRAALDNAQEKVDAERQKTP